MSNSRIEKLIQAVLNGESLENFKPQSRIEAILKNCCERCGCDGLPTPRSRNEALLYRLAEQLAGGGGGGADDVLLSILDGSITEFSNDKVTKLCSHAFAHHIHLETVDLPNVTSLEGNCFEYCVNLKTVNVPKLKEIHGADFRDCTDLKFLDLPSVTRIGAQSFDRSGIETLILRSPDVVALTHFYADTFKGTPIINGTGYIYVPAAQVGLYEINDAWGGLFSQIRAIEDYPDITGG